MARGLFDKAIAFSGASMAVPVPPLAQGEKAGEELAARLGKTTLADLRSVPADTLVKNISLKPADLIARAEGAGAAQTLAPTPSAPAAATKR